MQALADSLLGLLLAFIGLAAVTDFLLGKEGRRKVREKIGWWWLHLDDHSLSSFVSLQAKGLLATLERIAGTRHFLLKAVLYLLAINLTVGLVCIAAAWLYGENLIAIEHVRNNLSVWPPAAEQSYARIAWTLLFGSIVPNAIADSISILVSLSLLSLAARSKHPAVTISIVLLDIAIVFVLLCIQYGFSESALLASVKYEGRLSVYKIVGTLAISIDMGILDSFGQLFGALRDVWKWDVRRIWGSGAGDDIPAGNWKFVTLFPTGALVLLIIAATSAIPTLVHVSLITMYGMAKVLRRVIEPVCGVLLSRLYNEDRPVFTVVAVILAAVIKIVQEVLEVAPRIRTAG